MERFPGQTEAEYGESDVNSATESALEVGPTGELEAEDSSERAKEQKLGTKVLEAEDGSWKRQSSFVRAETEPDYEDDFTEQELVGRPEQRFRVNPDRFPILRDQAISNERIGIDETLSILVKDTADTIARLTGETDPPTPKFDAVIYLDKSARPVSWLVNELWDDFTTAPRPEFEGFLAIDRVTWFRAVGLNVDNHGNLNEDTGLGNKGRQAGFSDFRRATEQHPVPRSDLARARLALTPGGMEKLRETMTKAELVEFDRYNPLVFESHDRDRGGIAPELPDWIIDKIFALPTGLEGKRIMVIDEVSNSGATAEIAKEIVSEAVGGQGTEVDTHIFWQAGTKQTEHHEAQMQSAPVWYDHDVNAELGKGIGDVDFRVMREEFSKNPDFEHLNALYIAPFRGRSLDLAGKEGESSVELMQEFQRLAKIYRDGRILMASPRYYDPEKWIEHYEKLGVEFTPDPKVKNSYANLKQGLK